MISAMLFNSKYWLILLFVSSVKASGVCAVTYFGLHSLRRTSAAARHWIGSLALFSTLLIPLLTFLIPSWSISVGEAAQTPLHSTSFTRQVNPLPSFAAAAPHPTIPKSASATQHAQITLPGVLTAAPQSAVEGGTPAPMIPLHWPDIALALWALGGCATIARWFVATKRVKQVVRKGWQNDDPAWDALSVSLRALLHIRRPVELVFSETVGVPLTFGLRRPVIVLPCSALNWSAERRRIVLLHELVHIARWDYLTQWLSLIGCAMNWFNPLIWKMAQYVSIEREQACDDQVLNLGTKNSEYAHSLLEISQSMRQAALRGGLAMARGSDLACRIRRILDSQAEDYQSRRPLNRTRSLSLLLAALLAFLPLSTVRFASAATPGTILTLAVTDNWKQTLTDSSVLSDFEAANPGVSVKLVDTIDIPVPSFGLAAHFAALQKYASSADVLEASMFSRYAVTPQATSAGYLLDMAPLVNSDPSLNTSDFQPALWGAFQWDAGIWALPTSATVALLTYDKKVFDQAGLNYPDGSWTLTDFVTAVKKLSVTDTSGHVTVAGFANSGKAYRLPLFRSLIGSDLADESVIPNLPKIDTPAAAAVKDAYHQLEQQGFIGSDPSIVPMIVDDRAPPDRGVSLLPGGKGDLMADGFAISKGTQHIDLAYKLVKFLTTRSELVNGVPARKSLGSTLSAKQGYPASIQPLIDQALANGLTPANLRFYDYLDAVHFVDGVSTAEVLSQTAAKAVDDMKTAISKKASVALTVNEPAAPNIPPGKIAIKFDMSSDFFAPNSGPTLPNPDSWTRVVQDFTTNDPQVGYVDFNVTHDDVTHAASSADCFYLPTNAVPTAAGNSLLALDPFLTADPTFDQADLIGNLLSAVQRGNKTYALPLTLEPMILRYDSARFSAAHLSPPTNTWTVEAFNDALRMLKANTDSATPFADNGTNGTYLLVLMAAYGGLPLDYRSNPPTINFTDPATVAAIRQVLDLAKGGYIKYGSLGSLLGRSNVFPDVTTAVYPSQLNALSFSKKGASDSNTPVLFPTGHTFNGVAYDLGAAYISAQSPNVDACYRFIRTLSQHPELFAAMPVRNSQLASAEFKTSVSPEVLAMYTQFATTLNDPHTVAFPTSDNASALTTVLAQHWLFEAFDSYVLNNDDLDAALKDADTYAKAFVTCTANLTPLTTADTRDLNAVKPYIDCAEHTDPRLKPVFDQLTH